MTNPTILTEVAWDSHFSALAYNPTFLRRWRTCHLVAVCVEVLPENEDVVEADDDDVIEHISKGVYGPS